ncbi:MULTISPECIES: DUF1801 domain-containing protein [unclassified Oceanispirochaeta]|uniref:DUF1801 domain-containing protein n=1 Tax=unclassified Oceanispirochaeta TaxID=2635722 RepID=UPI000E096804|nr:MULTISPECIES: DUF1801 domain-containing protein [unclassified Oceanispirochaeta]MBF9015185.1 DUF1801 domain-containing protein [Oceanispirochaeta sp. M2]NPD71643.1 DUF1801 domain-containing protein [Oceanispirochaeta sp. M1]RDG33208.1 DUF1801 domain-containing protein [Oceanispirochaeta sp. M1]
MAENKTKPTLASVDDFISNIDNPRRKADSIISLKIYEEITKLPPVMWGTSIIGFGELRYKYESGREGIMPIAGFSPRKSNMTYYIGDEFKEAAELYNRLGKYKKSVACLYINKLDDIDLQVLKEIIACDFEVSIQSKDSATCHN